MLLVALVTNKHNDNVRIGVVAKFLEPAGNIGVRRVLGNIIDEESAHRTAVVGGCDCPIAFLTSSVPDLRLNRLAVYVDGTSGELNANGRL